ncbi:hypothetical protein D3C72_1415430 [compost metagenome]
MVMNGTTKQNQQRVMWEPSTELWPINGTKKTLVDISFATIPLLIVSKREL